MNKYIISSILFLFSAISLFSQDVKEKAAENAVDSIEIVEKEKFSFSALMDYIESSVILSDSVFVAMSKQIDRNSERSSDVIGYKLRIYFDNAQNARVVSEQIVDTFSYYYPNIPVYRTYVNPYFKVTVGNFRTKSDAMRFLEAIKSKYPAAFLIREPISTT